jgi:putative restriction endonuclease
MVNWLERLYSLRRDKRGTYERPHKPVLLLSILDLLDRGTISRNAVPLSDPVIQTFRKYFAIVRRENDQPSIENPFYFLSGDGFWHLAPQPGQPALYETGNARSAPSVAQLRRRTAYGRFDESLWDLLREPRSRHQIREALVARYFPEHRKPLAALAGEHLPVLPPQALNEEPPGRDAAFRKIILELYDYRCAACGVRVLLGNQGSLVEAAHLIPFGISRNDKPTNGLALCPNHHWAMDRNVIAPCPDRSHRAGVWRVHPRLDDRIEGQRDLVRLAGRPVIPPGEEKFLPASEALEWRCRQLTLKY